MNPDQKPERNLEEYSRQTQFQLIIGAVLILVIVGLGLIGSFYGWAAAGFGLVCVLAGLAPIALIALFFGGVDWIIKYAKRKQDQDD